MQAPYWLLESFFAAQRLLPCNQSKICQYCHPLSTRLKTRSRQLSSCGLNPSSRTLAGLVLRAMLASLIECQASWPFCLWWTTCSKAVVILLWSWIASRVWTRKTSTCGYEGWIHLSNQGTSLVNFTHEGLKHRLNSSLGLNIRLHRWWAPSLFWNWWHFQRFPASAFWISLLLSNGCHPLSFLRR